MLLNIKSSVYLKLLNINHYERLIQARHLMIGTGIRDTPSWNGVFWIRDAAGSIPPVCGDGLAIAITSGHMAADFYLKSSATEFKTAWLARYKKRFFIAKCLHKMMIHPKISPLAIKLGSNLPWLPNYIWKLTRECPS